MDTEDREHFKTIGLASPRLQINSSSKPNEGSFPSGQDQAFRLKAAKTIFACYRKDEAHDPEVYAAAVAAVLAEHTPAIVTLAADPRTGIAGRSKFLPSVAEVKEFCDAMQDRQARIDRYASLPKFARVPAPPPSREANLFVPVGFHRYAKMLDRHNREPEFCRFENGHTCKDGVARDGLWVPLSWWEEPRA